MDDRGVGVAVTGIGAVTPFGVGREPLWEALRAGESAIGPLTGHVPPRKGAFLAGEISDFDPAQYLGRKGLRNMSRVSKLLMVAVKSALEESGESYAQRVNPSAGIVVGTAVGTLSSISSFDREALAEGPNYVSPLAFANTVWNSPAGESAIRFGLGGPNATIASGFTAGHDSVGYAADLIRSGRADMVVAAGAEQLSEEWLLAADHSSLLASGLYPVDDGVVLGEAACALVLERMDRAKERGARIFGEVAGYGSGFDPMSPDGEGRETRGWKRSVDLACLQAGVEPRHIGFLSLNRNGLPALDRREKELLTKLFNGCDGVTPSHSVKFSLGELAGASGAVQSAVALLSLAEGELPDLPESYGIEKTLLAGIQRGVDATSALVLGADPKGKSAALILRKAG